jgi:hypothetical protein
MLLKIELLLFASEDRQLEQKLVQQAGIALTLTSMYVCPEGKSRGLSNAGDIPNVPRCNYTLQLTKSKLSCTYHTASHHQAATQMLPFQLQ